jgi:hypothetical protein
VPNQLITKKFEVGLVAFHINGISRVDFAVEGGSWTKVTSMTKNSRTDVVEYWAVLDPSKFKTDGPVEIRAVVYPKAGIPKVMPSLSLTVNSGGTIKQVTRWVSTSGSDSAGDGSQSKPYKSIMRAAKSIKDANSSGRADYGIINLSAGNHTYGTYADWMDSPTKYGWLTIQAAPGVSKDKVFLVKAGSVPGLKTSYVRLYNLTVKPSEDWPVLMTSTNLYDEVWFDNCDLKGQGRYSGTYWVNGWSAVYVTSSLICDSQDGMRGMTLCRDVYIKNIGADAVTDSACVINTVVETVDRSGTDFHGDVFQLHGRRNQVVCYGLIAKKDIGAQGLFAGRGLEVQDLAYVNCEISNRCGRDTDFRVFQFAAVTENMLVKNCKFDGPAIWRTDVGFKAKNVVVDGCKFFDGSAFKPYPGSVTGVTYR